MIANKAIVFMCGFGFLVTACAPSQADFIDWMDDRENGPWQKLEAEHFIYWLQYRPLSYQALVQTQDPDTYHELVNSASGMEYYYLSLLARDPQFTFPSPGSPMRGLLESNYGYEAIRLEIGERQLIPAEYYYEPSYNLRPEAGMLLAFNVGEEPAENRTLRIIGPFDQEERALEITLKKIEDIPNFKL